MTIQRSEPDRTSLLRRGLAAGIAILALPVFFYTFVLDQWDGVTSYPGFDVIALAITGLIAITAVVLSRSRGYLLLPVVLAFEVVLLIAVDFSPVKPAKRAVAAIKPGMAESQVRELLDRSFPVGGQFPRPEIGPAREGVLSFVLDPRDGRYDAAVVEVTFRAGRVVSARFLAD